MVMKIGGLQKVSTIDYPGEICCVIFLWGCNFRCGFCYNSDLVIRQSEGSFSEEEILSFLDKRVGKLDGVTITGGEPLLSLDFDFVRKIREKGFKVKLDTNGSFPERLQELVDEGLIDYIAMDIKAPLESYSRISGVSVVLSAIEKSISIILDSGKKYQFRTTLDPALHTDHMRWEIEGWMAKLNAEHIFQDFVPGKTVEAFSAVSHF